MVPINYDLVLGADGKVRFVVLLEPPERTNMYESGTATYGYMYTQHDIDSDPPATPGWNNYPPYQHYEITYYGLSNPTYAVNACLDIVEDPEGEVHGMVGQGWNVETVTVTQVVGASWTGTFETTARVTQGTVLVYDEDGRWLQPPDEWEYTSGDGQHFALLGVTSERVTVCYRATSLARKGLPLGLAHMRLVRPVAKGQLVTWADVEVDAKDPTVAFRREMESVFAPKVTA